MHLSSAVRFVFVLLVLFVRSNLAHSEHCSPSNITYTHCSSHGVNTTFLSKLFGEKQLAEECHEYFVEQILEKSCHHHDHHDHEVATSPRKHKTPTTAERYIYGFIAVFIISALSVVGLLALPILYKISFEYVLNLFTAIAIGTLLGDAIFHLVPFVLGKHNHEHEKHDHSSSLIPAYQWKLLLAVFVLYIFYLFEVFLHWFAHYKHDHNSAHSNKNNENYPYTKVNIDADIEHSHLHHNHTHHTLHQHLSKTPSIYSNAKTFVNNSLPCTPCVYSNELHVTTNPFVQHSSTEKSPNDKSEQLSISPKNFTSQFSNELAYINPIVRQLKTIKSTGWMVLIGDGIHNFADGLAIAAAFSHNLRLGVATTIAIACHELPHEFGDYAVLLQSGFSHCRALLWNFLSATTAIIGFFVGSSMSNNENARQWIFAATIGMFLYIALVDLLPTLLSDEEFQWKRFIVINCGFLSGIIVMFFLPLLEDKIFSFFN